MKSIKVLLGENIKIFRLEANLSQEQLADLSSLHRTYIGSIERGERNVSLENIVHIAKSLNVTAADLLNGIS